MSQLRPRAFCNSYEREHAETFNITSNSKIISVGLLSQVTLNALAGQVVTVSDGGGGTLLTSRRRVVPRPKNTLNHGKHVI
jgi:hypothetical protein